MRILCALLFLSSTVFSDNLKPQALEKGDLIALVFPAWFLSNREEANTDLEELSSFLEKKGYRTILHPQTFTPIGNFSAEDEQRAKHLMDAWENPEVKAIWCVRGGWGCSKIIDYLDFDYIKKHPKIFIGMSDITSLHQALIKHTNLVPFLSPALIFYSIESFEKEFAFDHFESIVLHGNEGSVPNPYQQEVKVFQEGIAKGKLVGGTLSLVASLCGTPLQIDTRNKILLIEEIDERPYRVDRMLFQLKESGLFQEPAAVILANFKGCDPQNENELTLEKVFERHFKNVSYPVLMGMPSGHCEYQATIPLNIRAKLDTYQATLELLEPSVKF